LSDAHRTLDLEGAMDNWQSTFLRSKRLPRELMAFEIEAFFTFTRAERQLIEDRRRTELKFADSRSPVVIAVTQQIKAQG
jgi:hypothetical protein